MPNITTNGAITYTNSSNNNDIDHSSYGNFNNNVINNNNNNSNNNKIKFSILTSFSCMFTLCLLFLESFKQSNANRKMTNETLACNHETVIVMLWCLGLMWADFVPVPKGYI